jgi:hypothetical protein
LRAPAVDISELLIYDTGDAKALQQGNEFGRTTSGAGQDRARNSRDWESASGDASVNAVNWIDWA